VEGAVSRDEVSRRKYAAPAAVADANLRTAEAKEQERRKVLGEAVTNNQRAVSLANERYQAGLESLISVLDAQRQLFAAQDSLVQSDRAVAENLVALYKALGGGWEDVEQREMRERQEQPAPR